MAKTIKRQNELAGRHTPETAQKLLPVRRLSITRHQVPELEKLHDALHDHSSGYSRQHNFATCEIDGKALDCLWCWDENEVNSLLRLYTQPSEDEKLKLGVAFICPAQTLEIRYCLIDLDGEIRFISADPSVDVDPSSTTVGKALERATKMGLFVPKELVRRWRRQDF